MYDNVVGSLDDERTTIKEIPDSTATPITISAQSPTLTPKPVEKLEPTGTLKSSTFSITYLDVGQGDAAVIECDGHYMMIDGGDKKYSSKIYSYLKSNGINFLDVIVASHAHSDHLGGLAGALNYAKAELVLCPVTDYDSEAFRDLKKYVDKNGNGIVVPNIGDTYSLGSAKITINGLNAGGENDASIILTIDYQGNLFMFTGDAGKDAEEAALNKVKDAVTVLKVAHHGSDSSNTYGFLQKVAPAYAIISCGSGNEYGHPNEIVLNRLHNAGAIIYRTDLQGDIVFGFDGEQWYVGVEKEVPYEEILKPGEIYYTLIPDENVSDDSNIDRNNMDSSGQDYIGNKNSHVFHYPGCASVKRMKESNKVYFENVTREDVINKGYKSCGNCHP